MDFKKVLVIGTSNAIVKGGWFDGFQEAFHVQSPDGSIERVALGGAPFNQFLGLAERVAESDYDVVIVDTSPNDESYSEAVGSTTLFGTLYRDFIDLLSTRASVVVLRIPPRGAYGKNPQVSRLQQRICQQFGAVYYDTSAVLGAIAGELDVEVYRDKYHPQTAVAFRLGGALHALIQATPKVPRIIPRFALGRYEEYTDHTVGQTLVDVSTSLVSQKFLIMEADATHRFKAPVFLLGMYILTARTSTVLRLTGPRGDHRDILWFYRGAPRVGKVQFAPIPNGHLVTAVSSLRPWRALQLGLHSATFEPPFELAVSKMLIHHGE